MPRSSAEVSSDCKACFDLPNLISRLAICQEAYLDQDFIVSAEDAALGKAGRWSEARASEPGKLYTEVENRVLDILELATFCTGKRDGICGLKVLEIPLD